MDCYNHTTSAKGICRWCQKALCLECSSEIKGVMSCSGCTGKIEREQKIFDISAKLYGLSKGSKSTSIFNSSTILHILSFVILLGAGVYFNNLEIDKGLVYLFFSLSGVHLVAGFISYINSRQCGAN